MTDEAGEEDDKEETIFIAIHDYENLSDDKLREILVFSDGYFFDPEGTLFIVKKLRNNEEL